MIFHKRRILSLLRDVGTFSSQPKLEGGVTSPLFSQLPRLLAKK